MTHAQLHAAKSNEKKRKDQKRNIEWETNADNFNFLICVSLMIFFFLSFRSTNKPHTNARPHCIMTNGKTYRKCFISWNFLIFIYFSHNFEYFFFLLDSYIIYTKNEWTNFTCRIYSWTVSITARKIYCRTYEEYCFTSVFLFRWRCGKSRKNKKKIKNSKTKGGGGGGAKKRRKKKYSHTECRHSPIHHI